jgi:hypothetical protein
MWALPLQLDREQRCKDHSLEIDQARSVDVLISTCGIQERLCQRVQTPQLLKEIIWVSAPSLKYL